MPGRICINARFVTQPLTGVQRYALEICRRLPAREVVLLSPEPAREEYRALSPLHSIQTDHGRLPGRLRGHAWEQLVLPSRAGGAGVLWSPGGSGPLVVRRQVLTIHDLAMLEHPEWYSRRFVMFYRRLLPRLARRVARIITVSAFSRDRIAGLLGVDPDRICVIPLGVDSTFAVPPRERIEAVRARRRLDRPYVFALGAASSRKNHATLLRAWERLDRGVGDIELVIAGPSGLAFSDLREQVPLPANVRYLGPVPDEDLPALYAGASAFAYPSLYEGFGLPLLEAMACGTPVLTSDRTAMPETAGEAAVLVDPHDVEAVAAGLERLLTDAELRTRLRAAGLSRVAGYTWERAADLTWQVLGEAADDRPATGRRPRARTGDSRGSRPIVVGYVVEATGAGVGRHVLDLVRHLDRTRFAAVVYASLDRPDARTEEYAALPAGGVPLRRLRLRRRPSPMADLPAARRLARMCREDGVDLLHGHSSKGGLIARLAAVRLGIPVVYTANGFAFQMRSPLRPLYAAAERLLSRMTDRIVCVSAGEREAALGRGLPEDRLVLIPNGVDAAEWPLPSVEERAAARRRFGVGESEVLIGSVGRLTPAKGYEYLIGAMCRLAGREPAARVMIWGEGELRDRLIRLAEAPECVGRVRLGGYVDDLRAAYAAMDVFVLPSLWEGAPYVLMEAMLCGRPAVVSNVPGNRDIVVHGLHGLVVPPSDPQALAEALAALVADPPRRQEMGRRAREHVLVQFSIDRMMALTQGLYLEVLAARGGGPAESPVRAGPVEEGVFRPPGSGR